MSERKIRKLKERVAKSLARQNYDDALESALEVMALDPRDDRTMLKVGELHQRLGQTGAALKAYHRVADYYAEDGRLVRAISVLKMILDLEPSDTATAKKLSLLYAARGLPPSKAVKAMLAEKEHAAAHAPEGQPVKLRLDPALTESVPPGAPAPPARPAPSVSIPLEIPLELERPPAQAHISSSLLDTLASEEEAFAESAEDAARRQLAVSDLQSLDLDDLDLAFVEMAPEAAPQMPHTPLFSDLAPDELHALLARVKARRFSAGDTLVKEGETGASIFVVSDGEVIVRVASSGKEQELARLGEGAFFGEFGMLTDGKRHATVVADGEVEALEIHHDDLLALARNHPRVRKVLVNFYRKRAMETALAASRVFGRLDEAARKILARQCAEERHQIESMVLQEGDDGEGIFLVKRGTLRVESSGLTDEPVLLAQLGPGDFFGEISTLSQSPVTADVIANEACEVLKISRREVLAFCEAHPGVREALEETGKQRLHESIDRLSSAGLV